jgi:hypothetical protein
MSELGDEARALIDATQDGDDPSSIDRARNRARLLGTAAGLGIAASAAQAKAAAGSAGLTGSAFAGSSVKLALAGAALVAGVSASVAYVSRAPVPAPEAPAVQAQPVTRAAEPVPVAVPAALDHPSSVAAIEPTPAQPSVRVRPKASDRVRARRAARSAAQPAAMAAPAPEPAAQGSSLALELSLLGSAQQALAAGDFDRALAMLARHADRFPRGALVPERMAAQAIAHCGAGQGALGRQQLSALAREAPSSPLLSRASARCE